MPDESLDYATLVDTILHKKPGAGKALRTIRESAKISQRDVGHQFSRTHSAISGWESERTWPPKSIMLKLLQVYAVPDSFIEPYMSRVTPEPASKFTMSKGSYAGQDRHQFEHDYLMYRLPEVIHTMLDRAVEGSDKAIEMTLKYVETNEARLAARISAPRRVNQKGGSAATVTKALVKHFNTSSPTDTAQSVDTATSGKSDADNAVNNTEAGKPNDINEG